MDTVSVAGVRIDAAAAAAAVVFVVAAGVDLALDFLWAGGAVAASDCCEAAMSKAFRLRVVGAVVKDVLSTDGETARYVMLCTT